LFDVALVGGVTLPQPDEISLGLNGVLFLDELPEFKGTGLEFVRKGSVASIFLFHVQDFHNFITMNS
jgi:hypothetical protein